MKLEPEHWPAVSRLLTEALDLAPDGREAWLAALGPEQRTHAGTVRALLAAHDAATSTEFLGMMPAQDLAGWEEGPAVGLAPGSTLAGYTIDGELGRGGMSIVYRAHRSDGTLRRPVALKVPRSGAYTPESLARFARERDILAGLTHAAIARLYDAGVASDGQPYLAMELVEGLPVDTWCDQHFLDVRDRVALFLKVLDAVQYAHGHLIVHRDIKPSNIFITTDGEVKLLDFGIAKLLSEETGSSRDQTLMGTMPLTVSYASPEQIAGAPLGVASDVYSLAVLLFQILTGSSPYAPSRSSRAALEEAIIVAEPRRPSRVTFDADALRARGVSARRLARQLAGDLDSILLMALKKSPADRYQTVQALKEDLQRYLRAEPILALRDSLGYRTRKFVARHRWPTAATAVGVGVIAAFIFSLTVELRQARLERDRADRIATFMAQVFTAPDPSAGHPESVSARDLLDSATEQIDSDSAPDPEQRAALVMAMARSYTNLGAYLQSDQLLRRELARSRAALGPDADASVTLENELLWELYSAREHRAAVVMGMALLARERAKFGPDDWRTVMTESYLYASLTSVGRFAEAAELAQHAAEMQRPRLGATNVEVLDEEADAAYARFRAGKGSVQEAEAKLRYLVSQSKAQLGPVHFRTLNAINRLGVVLARENRYDDELALFKDAIARAGEVHHSDAAALVDLMDNSAAAMLHLKDVDGAERTLRQAIGVRLSHGSADNPRVGMEEYNLACVYAQRGRVDEAIRTLQSAIQHRLIPDAALNMQSDEDLAPLLGDPRFTDLVRKAHDLYGQVAEKPAS